MWLLVFVAFLAGLIGGAVAAVANSSKIERALAVIDDERLYDQELDTPDFLDWEREVSR